MRQKNSPNAEKTKKIKELSELISDKRTLLVASIKNIPASQFQEISKNLRGKAIIKVPKKSLIFRALDNSDGKDFEEIKKKIEENIAILFSDSEAFELALELIDSKIPAKAKSGQEAPEDIIIQPGPTNLPPGPAISELGNLGIPIQIEKGKIIIKEAKKIVKKGEKISNSAAEVMGKLGIKPFLIGFTPLCAYDNKEKKLYPEIKISREENLEKIKEEYSRALPFAVSIGYVTKETIVFFLQRAEKEAKILKNLKSEEENTKQEDKKDTPETKKEPSSEEENK